VSCILGHMENTLTTCTETNCPATFNYIAERNFPTLCLEHAADADRTNGWTPENSQN
jgi:hypothetical protein